MLAVNGSFICTHICIYLFFALQSKLLKVEFLCQRVCAFSSEKNVSQTIFQNNSSSLYFRQKKMNMPVHLSPYEPKYH